MEGLNRAKSILLEFFKVNKRTPRQRDEGMGGIVSACHKDYWKDFGIKSWNDLKEITFNNDESNLFSANVNYLKSAKYLGK